MSRFALALAAAVATMCFARGAAAGGMYLPDSGTEALGRGGAFVAKADDPTAIYHNVSGLAQQRGTRLLVNANFEHSELDFQRSGTYPGDPKTQSYAGKKFAPSNSEGGISTIPFFAVTSDFGLENVTFALGTFPPPVGGSRVYPLVTKDGLPSPVRYDSVGGGGGGVILFHTAAAGFKLGEHIELGLAAHVVQVSVGQRLVQYIGSLCKGQVENTQCDAGGEATLTSWSGTGSLGAMIRPTDDWSIGLHFMGPTKINAQGVAKITAPKIAADTAIPDSRVAYGMALPWMARAGVRKTFGGHAPYQQPKADLELDMTYEGWGDAMNPEFVLEKVPLTTGSLHKVSTRNFNNTMSFRGGGSVTPDLPIALTLRGGVYYDTSATNNADTRVDTDTLDKLALTVGAGLRFNAWRIDVAYASVFDISRTVEKGAGKADAPATNVGFYSGRSDVLSLGATIELDILFRGARLPKWKRGEGTEVARR